MKGSTVELPKTSADYSHSHGFTKSDGQGGVNPFTGERVDSCCYLVSDGTTMVHPFSFKSWWVET